MAGIFKTTKKFATSSNESITLDIKHKEMLNKFRIDSTGTKPALENEKKNLSLRLKSTTLSVDERINLGDKLRLLKTEIKKINKAETNYLLNNSQYIFEYFEDKKNIAECKNKTTMIEHFFNTKDNNSEETKTKEISYVSK